MSVLFRAIVMLVVLVGLPAAWVYYGPLPGRVQGVVDRVVAAAKETLGLEKTAMPEVEAVAAPYFDPAVVPVAAVEKAEVVAQATEVASPGLLPTRAAPTLEERVAPLLERLRTLGASDYSLEKWGNDGQLYRFCCAMPLSADDHLSQQFEAVNVEPGESIQEVLTEVTNWQMARSSRIVTK